jgi:hypothetical protein
VQRRRRRRQPRVGRRQHELGLGEPARGSGTATTATATACKTDSTEQQGYTWGQSCDFWILSYDLELQRQRCR